VAGVDDHDRVVRHVLGEIAAHARRMDRHLIRGEQRVVFRVPLLADALRSAIHGFALARRAAVARFSIAASVTLASPLTIATSG
jgi:hypothetical protein